MHPPKEKIKFVTCESLKQGKKIMYCDVLKMENTPKSRPASCRYPKSEKSKTFIKSFTIEKFTVVFDILDSLVHLVDVSSDSYHMQDLGLHQISHKE